MAHRSQCSSFGDVDRDPGHVPPHYKEYYRIAIDILAEEGIDAYYQFLAAEQEVDFLSSTEIEHINKHLKKPTVPLDSLDYTPATYEDSDSSGTYWPVHTDIAAPVLDLGWPSTHTFRGPSDVTIFVHPPAPDTLSIKEEVRRLIRSATQVIAIVMDIFTDIDLFDEVLEAASRGIPVYLLLDEMFSHHFLDMVKKCQVNLGHVHFLRVRTLVGSTYYCRSGMSFTGNLIERFLLVDSNAVLCGSYSFMWSFEKIHRSIVQRFQGELVAIFDEEFRILYAQSRPLAGLENVEPAMDNYYSMTPYPRISRSGAKPGPVHRYQEDILSQHSGHSWAESDPEHFPRIFRQDGEERRVTEGVGVRGYGKQFSHFQQDRIQFDPTSNTILRAKRMEMNSYKRRSYTEDMMESSDYQHGRITEHYDGLDVRSEHLFREKLVPLEPGLMRERFNSFNSRHRLLDRLRHSREELHLVDNSVQHGRHGYEQRNYEEAFLSGYPLQPPLVNYEPSNSSKEVRYGSSELEQDSEGRLGLKVQKRPNIGQSYSCQKSPTQKQVLDPKMVFQESSLGRKSDDQPTKLGLRRWRLGSYLGEHSGLPEDTSAADRPPTSDKPDGSSKEGDQCESTLIRDPPQFTSYKRFDLYSKLQKVDVADGQSSDQGDGEQTTKLAKHASLRSKLNPLQQRGSRLRSSLIFSSSKLEQHISQKGRKVLSIREQIQNEVKESEEQEPPAAGETAGTNAEDQASQSHQLAAAQSSPGEPAASSQANPGALLEASSALEPEQQPESSGPVVCPNPQQKLSKVDLQLSKKVQDALNKMVQHTPTSKEVKPPPPDKAQERPSDRSSAAQPCADLPPKPSPQPSELETKPHPTGPQPSQNVSAPRETQAHTSATTQGQKSPSSTSTSTLEEVSGSSAAKVKLHSSAVCPNAVENGEGAEGGPPNPQTVPKASPKQRGFLNLPADGKSKESPISPIPGQTAAAEGEKGPEKAPKNNHAEASEKEDKLHRSPTHPTAAKVTPLAQGSRYSSTTSNILYSSNLRDDTKVILEQISANSQKNRAESTKAQLPPVNEADGSTSAAPAKAAASDAEKTDADKKLSVESLTKHKGRVPSAPDHMDPLIKRMDSFRKERRVYSRFEVFYKKDEPLKTKGDSGQQDPMDVDGTERKKVTKFIPKIFGTFRRF
ncbi:protein FAM83H [Pristis pectinata]|uniref:protein FAM83H n=1 Tax=Pristis pectinata TaxID=685728 RepID=UPI00223DA241|nr:protein FAM83H [Pristis pectinata]XP_051872423.1 protein FAM83H [Pristis pectinata]